MNALKWLRRLDQVFCDTVWPLGIICPGCGAPSRGRPLCAVCATALAAQRLDGPLCQLCGHQLDEDGACAFCMGDGLLARSVWFHRDTARQLVLQLKHQSVAAAADILAEGIAETYLQSDLPRADLVTWVTMPEKRRLERGIDHGRLLAEKTAERLKLPACQTVERTGASHLATQARLSAQERTTNLLHTVTCPKKLSGCVLLVDDVMTTGSTARVCRKALMDAGAVEVVVVTATQA